MESKDTNSTFLLAPAAPSVIRFVEAMGLELYPQQVAILKDYYGEPLSEWEKEVANKARVMSKSQPQPTDKYLRYKAAIVSKHIEEGTLDEAIESGALNKLLLPFHIHD